MTRRWLVRGWVQGVGFRYFVARRAAALGLSGWVRNLPDGRVETQASGPESALNSLEAALSRGPAHAVVEGVDRMEISDEVQSTSSFEIR